MPVRADLISCRALTETSSQFSPELFIADLPVSIKGGVVKRRVSSAVHTIHIGASPDTVPKKERTVKQKHNTANKRSPALCKVSTVGVTECVVITISVQQPSPTCTQVGVCSHAGSHYRTEAVAASDQNRQNQEGKDTASALSSSSKELIMCHLQ